MKYAYEDISPDQFEELIILICHKLFGISVQCFSKGIDGGRDAKFIGKAEAFPSKSSPWNGITIIQAKHTNGYNRSCSENDFFNTSAKSSIILEEIDKIKMLKKIGDLDNYILFTNRKLTANMQNEIHNFISSACDIPVHSIYIYGVEQIELYLKIYPDIIKIAKIDPLDSPLIISPDDLAEVVEAFAKYREIIKKTIEHPPKPRITYMEKNEINNMDSEYAKSLLKKYLKETAQIKTFLAAPENSHLLESYCASVEEFNFKIFSHRKSYQEFNKILDYISDMLFSRDPVLKKTKNKTITRTMLFYMYWNCDIGKEE
ncbi:ABC-three component system protein [Fluviispira sanaruensis]|uniref:ABC-three component systems C-terminal domain-containing protein n=1 Tax=Fluviispira sanaruensis TaxID=2493639 RepID=A0A4V0P2R2_FLUSA|nr:ABC-three component system protein [Fluviispira sanaruensis]BBH54117.1 hypothetical protein JCM31447_25740 [Fluviispira sanaruensis]